MATPALAVETPTAVKRPGGLLSVADVVNETDVHVALGVTYASEGICGVAQQTPDQCLVPSDSLAISTDPKTFTGFDDVVSVPLSVYRGIECFLGSEDYSAVARRALEFSAGPGIEAQFQTLVLNNATPENTAATPYSVAVALGVVERVLAETYGGVGIVHVPLGALNLLVSADLLSLNLDGTWTTANGNRVAAGAGYSPDLPSPYFPIWATPMVHLYPGQPIVTTGQNLTINTQAALAEQTFHATIDCDIVALAFASAS